MFTTDNELRYLRDWYAADMAEPGSRFEAIWFTPDVISDLLKYGHAQWTDVEKKRYLRMTILGRRFIHDYLNVYHMLPEGVAV